MRSGPVPGLRPSSICVRSLSKIGCKNDIRNWMQKIGCVRSLSKIGCKKIGPRASASGASLKDCCFERRGNVRKQRKKIEERKKK